MGAGNFAEAVSGRCVLSDIKYVSIFLLSIDPPFPAILFLFFIFHLVLDHC